jgi:aminoglycoside phosphotransferase (APT) family kinase protein
VTPDTAPVRAGEELDLAALAAYLGGKIDGAEHGLTVEQFPGGHSNLTYLLRIGGREYVLRRAPLGPVPPKAHDMAREYRVLHAVHPHFPEAPAVYHLCEDSAVIGTVFFLMERRRGIILREQIPPDIHPQRISEAFVDCLVRLHAIDVSTGDLAALGRPKGFVERQVRGWTDRWSRAQTEPQPQMEAVIQWLAARLPPSLPATLVHNDYKLDNVMIASTGSIAAVLDWEMTTIGDPLADLGLTLCYWAWANAPEVRAAGIPAITGQPGWYTREQLVDRYAERTGRDLTHLGYHEVLGVFKLAVIIQQIYYRFWRGQTHDERFRNFGERVTGLVRLAASLAERYT